MPTFAEENRAFLELFRELTLLRTHNLQFRQDDPQDQLLLFAESALVNILLEHFVRIVVGDLAQPAATLHTLLEIAVARNLLVLPWDTQENGIRELCAVRNTTLHGNYAQAAQAAGCGSVREYFRTQAAAEIERLFQVVINLMEQIDFETGRPHLRPA